MKCRLSVTKRNYRKKKKQKLNSRKTLRKKKTQYFFNTEWNKVENHTQSQKQNGLIPWVFPIYRYIHRAGVCALSFSQDETRRRRDRVVTLAHVHIGNLQLNCWVECCIGSLFLLITGFILILNFDSIILLLSCHSRRFYS